ncbi:MAG TPA: hypothetical protein VGP72_00280 [Planctomycetota bacterium]
MAESEPDEEKDLLVSLVYGVLHEKDPVSGATFAARLAVCARLTHGDQDAYTKAVKKAVINEESLTELFPGSETEAVLRSFLRVIRRARNNPEMITYLQEQFEEKHSEQVIKDYLVAVERSLANSFLGKR